MLNNLKNLYEDLKNNKWTICSFIFIYKGVRYVVLVKRFVGSEKRISEFALLKLHFINQFNENNELQLEANSKGLIIPDKKMFRAFFGIEYSNNLGDIIKQFTSYLSGFVPTQIPKQISESEKSAMVKSLSHSDSENPNKIYCFAVKRNQQGKRSEFNLDKTRLLRHNLYRYFKDDESISFCYSEEQEKERSDIDIIEKFSLKHYSG